jgi:hypothetical protein
MHMELSRVLHKLMQQALSSKTAGKAQDDPDVPTNFVYSHFLETADGQSVCNHVNQCLDLVTSTEECLSFATLNLACAESSNQIGSFDHALTFIRAAHHLIQPDLEGLPEHSQLARAVYLNYVIALYRLVLDF